MKSWCFVGLVVVGIVPNAATAADGMYLQGYGIKEQGMGGASIAAPQTAVTAANNPAGMGVIGDRVDIGTGVLYTRTGTEFAGEDFRAKDGFNPFPEFGVSRKLNEKLSIGISGWGGGAGVDYGKTFGSNLFPTNSKTSDQLIFINVAPTVSFQFAPRQWIGVSAVGSVSTIFLKGIEAQTGVSNRGRDWAFGVGGRIGWLGELTDTLSAGAYYSTPVYYNKFDKYRNVFADSGKFQQPASFGFGLAYRPNEKILLAFDYSRVLYAKTKIIGNHFPGNGELGSKGGPGFGWNNLDIFKVGAEYKLSTRLSFRAGFAGSNDLIDSKNTALNFAAPLTTKYNATSGLTYKLNSGSEISLSYAHGFYRKVKGSGESLNAITSPYSSVDYFSVGWGKSF